MCSTRVMVCAPVPQPRSSTRSIDPRPSTKSSARLMDPTELGPSRSRDLCSSITRSSIEGADRPWCFLSFSAPKLRFCIFSLKRRLFTLEETGRPTGVRHGITGKQPLCNMRGIVRFSRFVGQLLYAGSAEFMRFSVLACACCSHNTDSIFPKAVLKNLRPKSATSNGELNKMLILEAAIAVFEPTRGCDEPLFPSNPYCVSPPNAKTPLLRTA